MTRKENLLTAGTVGDLRRQVALLGGLADNAPVFIDPDVTGDQLLFSLRSKPGTAGHRVKSRPDNRRAVSGGRQSVPGPSGAEIRVLTPYLPGCEDGSTVSHGAIRDSTKGVSLSTAIPFTPEADPIFTRPARKVRLSRKQRKNFTVVQLDARRGLHRDEETGDLVTHAVREEGKPRRKQLKAERHPMRGDRALSDPDRIIWLTPGSGKTRRATVAEVAREMGA